MALEKNDGHTLKNKWTLGEEEKEKKDGMVRNGSAEKLECVLISMCVCVHVY